MPFHHTAYLRAKQVLTLLIFVPSLCLSATLKTVQTSMLEIAYEESGPALNSSNSNNPAIVLLHGWPYSIRQYDAVVSKLVRNQTQAHTILVPYLRGFGETEYLEPSEFRALLVGFDWGGRAACSVAALQPSRITGLVTCQGYAIQNVPESAGTPAPPRDIWAQWYQFYLNSPNGARCLEVPEDRNDLAEYCWELWSPNWNFTKNEFTESAKAFENPDFGATSLHGYRYRWATVPGQANLQALEMQLDNLPLIGVSTISLRGGSDGVIPPDPANDTDRPYFTGFYERIILPSVGHCPPAEDPNAMVAAIERLLNLNATMS